MPTYYDPTSPSLHFYLCRNERSVVASVHKQTLYAMYGNPIQYRIRYVLWYTYSPRLRLGSPATPDAPAALPGGARRWDVTDYRQPALPR